MPLWKEGRRAAASTQGVPGGREEIYRVLGEKGKAPEGADGSLLCPILNVRKNTVHFEGIQEGIGEQAQVEKAMNRD